MLTNLNAIPSVEFRGVYLPLPILPTAFCPGQLSDHRLTLQVIMVIKAQLRDGLASACVHSGRSMVQQVS